MSQMKNLNVCLLRSKNQDGFLVVKDKGKSRRPQFKHPGGLEDPDLDQSFQLWFDRICELVCHIGYGQAEIDEITGYEQMKEKWSPRCSNQRSGIRKILEKTGIYVPEMMHVYYEHTLPKYAGNDPVDQNFFCAKMYLEPKNPEVLKKFKCADPDVLSTSWVSSEELLSDVAHMARTIISTHKKATEKVVKEKLFARKIGAWELSYMAVDLKMKKRIVES